MLTKFKFWKYLCIPAVNAQTTMVSPVNSNDMEADHRLPSQLIPTMEQRSAGSSMEAAIMKDR